MKYKYFNRVYIGNFLMALSVSIFLYIYYPILALYMPNNQQDLTFPQNSLNYGENYMSIPKIEAYAPIVPNVDPWNETIYRQALKSGVAQAAGSTTPDEDGTTYIFAHSSDYPWNITRTNVVFFRLPELNRGDQVEITWNGQKYRYVVADKKEVWPDQVQYLTSQNISGRNLILQTCTPVGTSLKRLLVFAKQVN